MKWEKLKLHLPVIFILLFAAFLRFAHLNSIPNAITGDELHYAITAKSVFLTGKDISGTWSPLSAFFFRYPPGEQQAELPYVLHLVAGSAFPFSLFWAKLPFALLSVGIVLLLYGIAKELFGETTGIATGLVAAINPWLIVMGRTGYESTPATFFYLLGLYLMITRRILWAFIPFMLGFYSYIGTKLIFVPFVCLAAFLAYKINKKSAKQYVTLIALSLVFTAFFVFQLKTSPDPSRVREILLPNSSEVKSAVDEIRRISLASPILPFLVNKYAVYVQILVSKLYRIFSPSYLFIEGDQFFLPGRQSFFYYLDFLFLVIGSLVLYAKRKLAFWIVGLFILLGTFPHLFHKTSGDFSGHLTLMFPFLILLIGVGIAQLRSFALGATILLYIASVASFITIYFFQIPLVGAGDFRMRVLSRYITLANTPIIVHSNTGEDFRMKHQFYSNQGNQPVSFLPCDATVRNASVSSVLIYDTECNMTVEGPNVFISRLSDGGQLYKIFGDEVCGKYPLTGYASGVKMSDFTIEQLSEERFCMVYVHR